jgi:hypothetical protein
MTEISKLPRRERAKRYREMAWKARGQAAHSKGEMKTAFIKIAEQWEQLALEAEAEADESGT